jgi:hypothetical protein
VGYHEFGSIDLYFRKDFQAFRARVDFVKLGATGTFDKGYVSFSSDADEWGEFDPPSCDVTFDTNEHIGEDHDGAEVWSVSGSASCDGPLTPFQSQGKVQLGDVSFVGSYTNP